MPLLRAKELTDIVTRRRSRTRCATRGSPTSSMRARPQCPTLAHGRAVRRRTPRTASTRARRRSPDLRQRRHGGRRHGAHRVHVGHDRQAEGHDALPSRRDGRVRLLAALDAQRDRPTTSSPAARRSRSRSGWAACCCFRCASARRRCWSSGRRRMRCCPRSRSTARRCCSRRRRPTARWRRSATSHDLSSLRKCVSAGEALPAATRKLWKDATGIEMIDGIGSTEMLHIFISHDEAHARPGATGQPVPGYHACVMDDARTAAAAGRGRPARGARDRPAAATSPTTAQRDYVKDGWNYTGDAYLVDDDGYFVYQARTDDMIVSAGYNIAGPEVEGALLLHPAVAECGVVGVARRRARPDRQGVRRAEARASRGDAAMAEALQDHVKQAIAPYKYPRAVEFLTSLPRTETGKLQRFRLREMARGDGAMNPSTWRRCARCSRRDGRRRGATPTASRRAARWSSSAARSAGTRAAVRVRRLRRAGAAGARQHRRRAARGGRAARARRAHDVVRRRQARVRRELPALGAAYREVIGRHFPAMTAVEVRAGRARATA